jgi:hypothetical protein
LHDGGNTRQASFETVGFANLLRMKLFVFSKIIELHAEEPRAAGRLEAALTGAEAPMQRSLQVGGEEQGEVGARGVDNRGPSSPRPSSQWRRGIRGIG